MRAFEVGLVAIGVASSGIAASTAAQPSQAVTAGELVVEPPTLISLGFEWYIEGDADRDAAVAVAYRTKGASEWRDSLPLTRIQNERTFYVETLYYTAPNMFAGSVFELAENTEYEVRFRLTDPDGVTGEAERVVNVRTRAEPQPFAGGTTYHVYPFDYEGPKQEPAFTGLLAAYYKNALGGDWSRAAPPRVQPGDTLLVHAGTYKDFDRLSYSHEIRSQYRTCCGTPWDGTFYLTQDGTAERPIAIKAAGDGEVIFDGDGNNVLFNVMGADHTYFEGITFRNTNLAIEAGQKSIAGAVGLTVKHSTFDQVGVAIHSDWSGSKGFYIADNVMNGRNDPTYLIGWFSIWPWNEVDGQIDKQRMRSYYAVAIYGSGHVVAYNRVTNFHDGIDHATYGMPDGYPNTPRDRMPVSNDIYGNDVSNMHDNCFETDGGMHNMRVFRNRCFNAAVGAMSPQPIFGGPVYFVRNVVYNSVYGPLKIQADPSGILVYQNTYVGEIQQITPASNLHFRNNLIMGQKARPLLFAIDTHTPWSSSDYNGFHVNADAEFSFQWNSPPAGGPVDYTSPREVRRFKTLTEYQRATRQDRNSRAVDYSVFANAKAPDFSDPTKLASPDDVDLRLAPRSRAVDAGIVLPGITDGFGGRAPDLGAYELGAEPTHYGPRPRHDSPPILQITIERVRSGSEAEYGAIEEELASVCARLGCPNSYLALLSVDEPKDVWWLVSYASEAEVESVAEGYANNPALLDAMRTLASKKAGIAATVAEHKTTRRADLSDRTAWRVGTTRFAAIAPDAGPGAVFESTAEQRFTIVAADTRADAAEAAARLGPGARVFEVRPPWSRPASEWTVASPELWEAR